MSLRALPLMSSFLAEILTTRGCATRPLLVSLNLITIWITRVGRIQMVWKEDVAYTLQ